MDAKIGNFAVTPRNGKAVEVNSMWYNALKIMEELTEKYFDKSLQNSMEIWLLNVKSHLMKSFIIKEENVCMTC